jgi:ectoine hydroxylase-related dioxygenase (phytanoyl-CoA dioxygenase family)
LEPRQVDEIRLVFDEAWAMGDTVSPETRCWILAWAPFRATLCSHRLLGMLDILFQGQAQLLDYHPIYQPAANANSPDPGDRLTALRDWHRDFTFVRDPGGSPLMITVLIFIDDIGDEAGPTLVLPGTHRMPATIVTRHDQSPRADEQALPVRSGQGLIINSAIVHSRGLNHSERPRRGLVLNFGYWWMKPWDLDLPLPKDACTGIPADVERLLGLRCPSDDLYLYSPI